MVDISAQNKDLQDDIVSIVIITRNSRDLVKRCLDSIHTCVEHPFEIIVVDNGSNDDTVKMLMNEFSSAMIIRNKRNRGVAPARNQGLAACSGRYVLILDDDTYIINGAIDKLVSFMQKNPSTGLCGARLQYASGEMIYSCKRFPTLSSSILNRVYKEVGASTPDPLRRHLMIDWPHDCPSVVDYVIGACQLINGRALADVGFYDDSIFYGPEDIEFCFRLWKKGWEVWYVPDAHVVHDWRRSTKKKPISMLAIRHFLAVLRMHIKYRFSDFKRITDANDRRRNNIR